MTAIYNTFYAGRWMVFLLRLALAYLYAVFHFLTKPGSRLIVPVSLAFIVFVGRTLLHAQLDPIMSPVVAGFVDGICDMWNGPPSMIEIARRAANAAYYGAQASPWVVNGILVAGLLALAMVYYILSVVLALIMSAFPRIARPLRPLRRLRPTSQKMVSARVKIAVPRLRR